MKSKPMVTILLLAVVAFASIPLSFSQSPEIEWSRTYGGTDSDLANSVCATSDAGYIFAGYTKSFTADSNDAYLVKVDSLGNHYWSQLYGGPDYDEGRSVQQTTEGGYIIVGWTKSFGIGSSNIYLIRTNSQGDTLWTRTYGGSYINLAESLHKTFDGGYVISGYTRAHIGDLTDMFLVRIDSLGDTLWTRSFGGADNRTANDVKQTSDGGYILAGGNPHSGGTEYDMYLVKTDSLGDTLWTRTYGGSDRDGAVSVLQTEDGGYIATGYTRSFGAGEGDIWVIKTDHLGDTLWTRTYGSVDNEYATSMQETLDGGYIIAGATGTYGGETDLYLIKIDNAGDTLWTLIYGGEDTDVASSVDLTADGGYIVAGSISSWQFPADCWLVKTGPDTAVSGAPVIEWVSHPKQFTLHPAYPNPFNPTTTISFDLPFQSHVSMNIYNILGERVGLLMDRTMPQGNHRVQWDGSDYPSGIYFVRMDAGAYRQVRKVVLLR